MRIALREFVRGAWTVPQNPITGGMGDFVPGRFAVPQVPVVTGLGRLSALRDFVPGSFTVPQVPVVTAGVGDFANTAMMYPLFENSVLMEAQRLGLAGCAPPPDDHADCGCGCNGAGTCGGGLSGIIDDATATIKTQWAQIMAGDVKTIAIWGGGALVLGYLLMGSSSPVRRRRR